MYRRRALAVIAGAATLAGCSDSGNDGADGDGGSGDGSESVGDDGGSDGDDGESGDGAGDGGGTPTESPSAEDTATPTAAQTATRGDGSTGQANVRTPGPDDDHDWDALAGREETSGFDLPDGAPTAFGFTRVSGENTMTVSYGAMTGSDPVESGTVYAMFVVDGSVEGVVVWEPPIEDGDEFVVGPDDSVLPTDVGAVTNLVIAWESDGEVYVVDRNGDVLG